MKNYKKLTKREMLLVGAGIVCACAAGYFWYKYFNSVKFEDLLSKTNEELKDSVDTLMAAASEGVFEEALATVGRKIAYRKDRESYLLNQLVSHPGEKDLCDCLERVRSELSVLTERQNKFLASQKLYEIKNTIDA